MTGILFVVMSVLAAIFISGFLAGRHGRPYRVDNKIPEGSFVLISLEGGGERYQIFGYQPEKRILYEFIFEGRFPIDIQTGTHLSVREDAIVAFPQHTTKRPNGGGGLGVVR